MRYSARKNQSVFILRVEWTSAFKGFKQQRRRRLQKRHLKSEFAPAASNFIALTPSRLIDQMLADCLELNTKGLYQSSGKEKASCCLVFPSSTKLEITHFHVVVVQWRQRNVQKSVMHVLSFCFDTINLLLFCRSSCRRRRRCLSSLIFTVKNSARSCYVTGWKKHPDLASTRFRVHEFHSEERIQKVSDSPDTYQ